MHTLDAAQDLLDLGAAAAALQVHRDLQLAHLCNKQKLFMHMTFMRELKTFSSTRKG